jgi:hypothetical protein
MKKIFQMLGMLTIVALLAPLTTSCTNEDSELDPPFSLSTPKGSSQIIDNPDDGVNEISNTTQE